MARLTLDNHAFTGLPMFEIRNNEGELLGSIYVSEDTNEVRIYSHHFVDDPIERIPGFPTGYNLKFKELIEAE